MAEEHPHTMSDHLTLAEQECLFELIQQHLDEAESVIEYHQHDPVVGNLDYPDDVAVEAESYVAALHQAQSMKTHLTEIKDKLSQ